MNFKKWLIAEGVAIKDVIAVYHRTKADPAKIQQSGGYRTIGNRFKSAGSYGAGLYTTYDIESQLRSTMIDSYGPNIIKYEANISKFLILDPGMMSANVSNPIESQLIASGFNLDKNKKNDFKIPNSDIFFKSLSNEMSQVALRNLKDENVTIDNIIQAIRQEAGDNLENLHLPGEEAQYQFEGRVLQRLGSKSNNVYKVISRAMVELANILYDNKVDFRSLYKSQMEINEIKELYELMQEVQTQPNLGGNIARKLVELKGADNLSKFVPGILFQGRKDGKVCVIYNPKDVRPIEYAMDVGTSNQMQWERMPEALTKDQERQKIAQDKEQQRHSFKDQAENDYWARVEAKRKAAGF